MSRENVSLVRCALHQEGELVPHATALTRETWPRLLALVALANVAYCAAYLVDLPLQQSEVRDGWRGRRWWWWLWLAGTLFALLLAQYWITS